MGLGRGGGAVGGIVPSLNFVGKTSFAWAEGRGGGDSSVIERRWKDLIRSLFRVSLPSHFFAITFTDTYRHIYVSTRDTVRAEEVGRSGQGVWGGGIIPSYLLYMRLTLPFCAFASCWSHYRGLYCCTLLLFWACAHGVVIFTGLEVTLYYCYCYTAVIPYLNLAEPYYTRNAEPCNPI